MVGWIVERIVHFDFRSDAIVRSGCVHFGFHDRRGRHYGIVHQRHFLGLIGEGDRLEWTVAARPVFPDVPNIAAGLEYPMYVDSLPDGTLVVSNFKTAELYAVDPRAMTARLLVDGHAIGLRDMGNCVVDDEGFIWANEVTGCRVWRFDATGRPALTLGDGTPGFCADPVDLATVRFNWIYDIRRGPDGTIYVLDSRNYALRAIDLGARHVRTIAGHREVRHDQANDLGERDPLGVSLPQISSMDWHAGRLFIPTDLTADTGDLVVLRRSDR